MTIDAASSACCCGPTLPLNCVDHWQCSTLQRFRLNYECFAAYRETATSSAGVVQWVEHITTMIGNVVFQKTATAPALGNLIYTATSAGFNFSNSIKSRNFFSTPSCQPCGSTYISGQAITTAQGTTIGTAGIEGRCRSCFGFTGPRFTTFKVGGTGSYSRTTTSFNESGQGTPLTTTGTARIAVPLSTPDGCVKPSWFQGLHMFGIGEEVGEPTFGQLIRTTNNVVIASFPTGSCDEFQIPPRCNADQTGQVVPAFSTSGCLTQQVDTHICQQGFQTIFQCGCGFPEGETSGCVDIRKSYEQYVTNSIDIL